MTLDEYNAYCATLTATHAGVQWGGSHVWKVGPSWEKGKVFAIAGWDGVTQGERDSDSLSAHHPFITFKASELAYEILRDQPGCRPAPYLASRGMKWIQCFDRAVMDDDHLKRYLSESHELASNNLTRAARRQAGLEA